MIDSRVIQNKERKQQMFLIAYFIYLLSVILFASKYGEMPQMRYVFPIMRFMAYIPACAKIVLDFLDREYSWKELVIICGIGALLMVSYVVTRDKNLLIYWVFIVAAHDVKLERILKWSLIAHLAGIAFVIGSCYAGVLDNRIYYQGDRVRESLGFQYTTEGSNFFFYTILCWICWRKEKITWPEAGVMLAIEIFLYTKTDTRNALMLGTLAICGCMILKYCSFLREYKKGYTLFAVGTGPLASSFIMYVSAKFSENQAWMVKLDRLINGRLTLAKRGFDTYGATWLGQRIEWIGGAPAEGKVYNYVDSSYVQIFLNFGIVVYALVILGIVVLGICIAKKKDTYFLLVYVIVLVHTMFDPQLLWIGFDMFCMAYCYIADVRHGETHLRND
jgi:hypothetical protein